MSLRCAQQSLSGLSRPCAKPARPLRAGKATWLGLAGLLCVLAACFALTACGVSETASLSAEAAPERKVALTDPVALGTVIINEVAVGQAGGPADEDDGVTGWIELYNPGNQAVDLTGFGLSNQPARPFLWIFPAGLQLQPQAALRVWLSQKDRAEAGAPLHASFGRDSALGPVNLTAPDGSERGQVLDHVVAPPMAAATSWCRMPRGDASAAFARCSTSPAPRTAHLDARERPFLADAMPISR